MDLHYQNCSILDFNLLTPLGVDKTVFHIEISWNEQTPYRAGDSIAIRPHNRSDLVERVLKRTLSCSITSLDDVLLQLTQNWSITKVSGKFLCYLAQSGYAKQRTEELHQSLNNRELSKYFTENYEVADLLDYFDAHLHPQHFSEALMPLLPRFYSIASSPVVHPNRLALMVAHVNYYHTHGERVGVCSDYLYRLGKQGAGQLQAALHPAKDFLLADSQKDIIMVGPGTGVAPFRAFMQERLATKACGHSWLFFGERYRSCLFYESLWQQCVQHLPFKISCAFSREGNEKVYVQHRMKEHASQINEWLDHATFYVCGDAKHMAKDVEKALLEVIIEQRGYSEAEAKEFIKKMRAQNRYLRDIY